jgi:hypothetical protein
MVLIFIKLFLFLFVTVESRKLFPLEPSEIYTHHASVFDSDPNQYNIFWKVSSNDQIQFEVHVKTLGWIGLGVSTNGGMKGSDIAMGWYDKSGAHLIVCRIFLLKT